MPEVGKQTAGQSSGPIYDMARIEVEHWGLPGTVRILDVGGGSGGFATWLTGCFRDVHIVDHERSPVAPQITYHVSDLNFSWEIDDSSFGAVVALEVIEHLENPRHFMRELNRILRVGGRCFVSTPNQLSLASKLSLAARGHFRDFSDNCYPAHITALVKRDLERIAAESGFEVSRVLYTNSGRIPFLRTKWQSVLHFLRGQTFSDNIGISLVKRRQPNS